MQLVVDAGQSGARYSLSGQTTELQIAKKANESILETLKIIFQQIPAQKIELVCLSLTGLQGDVKDPEPFGKLCAEFFDSREVCIMDDGIASYVGALQENSGVVLTLGGGVVAVSSNNGKFGHADGKGPIFGDFGGGYWIGQKALQRAISTLDGRDDAQDLVELLDAQLEEYLKLDNKTGTEAATLCIEIAKDVALGAESGVKSAFEILDSGAQCLAKTIQSAWKKVSSNNEIVPKLSIKGGLSKSELYVELIRANTGEKLTFEYLRTTGDNLEGATMAANLYPTDVPPLLKWWRA